MSPVLKSGMRAKLNQKTLGFRSKGKLSRGFEYNVEMGKQFGRLANRHDGLYNSGNALVARSPGGSAGRYIGWDFDTVGTYSVSQAIELGVGCGHLFPGRFLNETLGGHSFTYP